MPVHFSTLGLIALVIINWGMPLSSIAASDINQQISTKKTQPTKKCQISKAALDAIHAATIASNKIGRPIDVQDLIYQADVAASPPECDSFRAKILADKAKQLAEEEMQLGTYDSIQSSAPTNNTLKISTYDGQLEFGLGIDIVRRKNTDDIGVGYTILLGKEIYDTESWVVGAQGLILRGLTDPEFEFNTTALYVTARPKAVSFLQFKVGLANSSLASSEFGSSSKRDSGTELAYGVGIVTGNRGWRIHWLDYEIYKVGTEKIENFSIGLITLMLFLR